MKGELIRHAADCKPLDTLAIYAAMTQYRRIATLTKGIPMGINNESDISADLQIGPTSLGAVRLFVVAGDIEIPMDFTPEEAEEIADDLRNSAEAARKVGKKKR